MYTAVIPNCYPLFLLKEGEQVESVLVGIKELFLMDLFDLTHHHCTDQSSGCCSCHCRYLHVQWGSERCEALNARPCALEHRVGGEERASWEEVKPSPGLPAGFIRVHEQRRRKGALTGCKRSRRWTSSPPLCCRASGLRPQGLEGLEETVGKKNIRLVDQRRLLTSRRRGPRLSSGRFPEDVPRRCQASDGVLTHVSRSPAGGGHHVACALHLGQAKVADHDL